MKKKLLFSIFTCLAFFAFNQNQALVKSPIVQASISSLENLVKPSQDLASVPKTLLCNDTIRYPQVKEQLLNATASFFTFTLWTDDAEYMSQAYIHTGGTITIPKIEFFGNRNAAGAASVVVQGAIYNVNASNVPTTLISSGTVTITSTTAGYNYITLSTPAVVTGNYAVVIRPTTANGQVDLFVNNSLAGQTQDEGLSKVRSTYYTQSLGNWVSVPVLTNDIVNFPAIYDFEALISPIVSYTINTSAVATTSPACLGTPVVFTNTTTPTGILNSRMYNYQRFNLYFGVATSDSTYAWDMGNASPLIWSTGTTYTYPAVGLYSSTLYTLGGFWASCTDFNSVPITINAAGNSNFNYSASSYCAGTTNQTPVINQAGTFSATPAGLNFVSTTTGQINLATSAPNTYTVSYTTSGPCPSTSTQTVTINPSSNSSFSYTGSTFCAGSANQTPTVNSAGTFSATPAGLIFVNTSTGEIDMAASANNSYTITHAVAGACPSSSQQSFTITSAPLGGFTYSQSAYCLNDVNQSPIFASGASGGVFTSNLIGLSISSSGVINPSLSVAGAYIVTNSISGGGCPTVNETFQIFMEIPTAVTFAPLISVCVSDPSFQLVGALPAMGVYSGTGVNGGIFSPGIATPGIHPITYTYSNGACTSTATQSITVGSIPIVTMAPFSGQLCSTDPSIPLPIATPAGGIYSGNGVTGNNFDPAISGVGTFQVTYAYVSAEGCEAFAFQPIVVNSTPNITFTTLNGTCVDHAAFALTGGAPAGGSYAGPGVAAGGLFDPSVAGIGTHTITYSFTSTDGCIGTATQSIMVDACAAIDELSGIEALIYPNPTNGELNIIINNGNVETLAIALISADGKEVLNQVSSQENINIQFNVSSFASGVYYVSIKSDQGKMIRKVVIE